MLESALPSPKPKVSCPVFMALPSDEAMGSSACLGSPKSAGPTYDDVQVLRHPVIQVPARLQEAAAFNGHQLPDELLVEIFVLLSMWDRVRAATVCHRWRRASLGSPRRLWSDIPTSRCPEACAFFLERAQRAPVTFRVQLRHDNIEAFSDIIKRHLRHMRGLDVTIPAASRAEQETWDAGKMHRYFEAALQGPAPMLQAFRLVNRNFWPYILFGPFHSLNNGVLRTIKLRGLGLSCLASCAGASNIRSLVTRTPESWFGFSKKDWSLLCSFHALESLSLKITKAVNLPDPGDLFPATLKRLTLELKAESFRQLMDVERFARLDFLRVSFTHYPHDPAELSSLLPLFRDVVAASGAIHFDGEQIDMMVRDAAGRQRIVQVAKCDPTWRIPFATAKRLSICGLGQLPSSLTRDLTALPALQELTLDVSTGHGGSPNVWFGGPRLECPGLRAVHVRSARNSFSIELGVVSDVLRLAPAKLATLVLDRVHVSALSWEGTGTSLHVLADTVLILDSGDVWPEHHSVWAQSWDETMTSEHLRIDNACAGS